MLSKTRLLFSEELITNIAAMVKGASLVNIYNTSFGDGQFSKMPALEMVSIMASRQRAVTSKLTFSKIKDNKAEKRSIKAITVSIPISKLINTYGGLRERIFT